MCSSCLVYWAWSTWWKWRMKTKMHDKRDFGGVWHIICATNKWKRVMVTPKSKTSTKTKVNRYPLNIGMAIWRITLTYLLTGVKTRIKHLLTKISRYNIEGILRIYQFKIIITIMMTIQTKKWEWTSWKSTT